MKITCQECQSKYTIADEKIQGKVAKIRCRKCGATVVVDGTAAAGSGGETEGATYTVNVAEGDQRTMTVAQLVDAYNTGVIGADTYVWKDGMTDWVPLAEVQEVVASLGGASAPASLAEGVVEAAEPQ